MASNEYVECELTRIITTDNPASPQMVVLKEKAGSRAILIQIGYFEAAAIRRHVANEESPRPLTHDLLLSTIEAMGGKIERIAVTDFIRDMAGGGTYYGALFVSTDSGTEVDIDCRPSDAIALATRTQCPIFVATHVLDDKLP